MNTLIFATNNQDKVNEIRSMLDNDLNIITLKEAGIDIDIPEPFDTLEANAKKKSSTISQLTGKNCFGEDTGLEVAILNGEPGVKSARYAGEQRSFTENVEMLLKNLQGKADKTARFRTVISLIYNNKEYIFEGICPGKIIEARRGVNGFGYDPIFVPEGSENSFAEMEMTEKNRFSHRRKAMEKLIDFLKKADFQEKK